MAARKSIEYAKEWRTKNKEKVTQYFKKSYEKNKEAIKERHRSYVLKSRYGLTVDDYIELHEKQKGCCAICKINTGKTFDVDHCHKSKKIRGLLCNNCNRALGHFKKSVENLETAIKYLKGQL